MANDSIEEGGGTVLVVGMVMTKVVAIMMAEHV
jgi:hypothetical protein